MREDDAGLVYTRKLRVSLSTGEETRKKKVNIGSLPVACCKELLAKERKKMK